jgi:two-component system, cell cycle response regulator DivK
MYRDYLVLSGFVVETAENGYEALEKARRLKPDLILMDLSLPALDGWEATRRLKTDPETAAIRVVALSAHAMAIDAERAAEAGCEGFIAKPCLPDDLLLEVTRHLHAVGYRSSARRPAPPAS